MSNTYHATPYDISASGFYFTDYESYQAQAAKHTNDFGQPVEEYEIQFIDGDSDDCELFQTLEVTQATLKQWLEKVEGMYWGEELIKVLYLTKEREARLADLTNHDLDHISLYEGSLEDYAEQYLEDSGLFAAVEKAGLNPRYVDVAALARDMEIEGTITVFEHNDRTYVLEGY